MAEYFHIPPEGGWEEHTSYVVEVSRQQGNPTFEAILRINFIHKGNPTAYSRVFTQHSSCIITEYQYIKAIRKIDMSIPNRGKQIKELNIFELKDHMKERPDVRFN